MFLIQVIKQRDHAELVMRPSNSVARLTVLENHLLKFPRFVSIWLCNWFQRLSPVSMFRDPVTPIFITPCGGA